MGIGGAPVTPVSKTGEEVFPSSLGPKTGANSLSVVPPTDGFKVAISGNPGTLTDKSGTIATGGTAQNAIAANTARNGFMIQNQSTGDLYFSTLAAAVVGQPSIKLAPGQSYETPANGFGTGAVSVIGATTAQAFAAREF